MSNSHRGSPPPTLLHEAPGAIDWTISDLAIEFAASVGYVLHDWQEWAVRWAFARRDDGLWAARDYGLEVPRQNGKNVVLEVVEIVALFALGEQLVIHSAHRADVSHEHFLSLKASIENSPDLMAKMPHRANNGFITANGKESVELANGNRLLFISRKSGAGRGPRPQRLVLDEALILTPSAVGDIAPGMTAQPNPQILFASSPPKSDSHMLHMLRKRAMEPESDDRLFYAAWNNPQDVQIDDLDAAYRVNPSLGLGHMTVESLTANRRLLEDADYLREHMGIPELELAGGGAIIPEDLWQACAFPKALPDGDIRYAIDASPDLESGALGASDGQTVTLEEHHPGVAWLPDKLVERGITEVWLDPKGPVGALLTDLEERGIAWHEVSPAEHAQASGGFLSAVLAGKGFRHLDQGALNAAVAGATRRSMGEAWAWSRRTTAADICPLVAVTLARWAALQHLDDTVELDGALMA